MITQTSLYPPQPSTARALSAFISYDSQNNRITYASGRSIVVRSLDGDRLPVQFTKHTFPTTVATFSPSGNYIASGDESGNVKIWDSSVYGKEEGLYEQPVVKAEYQILSGPIRSIAWDGDNQRVIAVGEGKDQFGHCFTWDSGNSVGEIQGHSTVINAVDIKPQRPYRAATVSADKALVFYNGPPFKFDKSVRGRHKNVIRDVKFSPDGKWLVSVGSDRTIVVYDGKTGRFPVLLKMPITVESLVFLGLLTRLLSLLLPPTTRLKLGTLRILSRNRPTQSMLIQLFPTSKWVSL